MKSAILLVTILCSTALASEEDYLIITSMTLVCQPWKPFAETTVQVQTGGQDNSRRIALLRVSNKDFDLTLPREALADLAMPMLDTLRLSTEPGYDKTPWMYVTFALASPTPGAAWDSPTVYLKILDGKFVGRSLKRRVGGQIKYEDLPVPPTQPAAIDPKSVSLAAALRDWITLLEKDDLKTASDRWAKDDQAAATIKQWWVALKDCHSKFDYKNWLDGQGQGGGAKQIGDAKTFEVGGHDFDHMHVDWQKTDSGWRIAKVWICR